MLLCKVVLDQESSELVFQQIVALNLSAQIFSKLLIGKDKFLHGALLLVHINFLHLSAVEGRLKMLDLASELGRFLSAVCIADLVLHVRIVFTHSIHLDLLFVDHSSQSVNHSLQFLN